MLSYATTEPGERDNELHSIFGTEVASLSPELEAHYAKFFSDRSKVVDLNASFEAVFDQIHEQETSLAAQVTAAGDAIDRESASYSADSDALSADVDDFNGRADAGDFGTQGAFDRERAALEERQSELAARYEQIQKDITAYDGLRDQLQALDSQAEELNRSLDSTITAP
jgi:chromosome segregation ATPase